MRLIPVERSNASLRCAGIASFALGVSGAVEQKTGLRIIVGWVSEGPKLASDD
jgi:hypothetical protein